MKCHQCDKAAMFAVTGAKVPLCLDCYIRFSEVNERHLENLERSHNQIAAEFEAVTGLPGIVPYYPARQPRTVLRGPVTLNHIRIENSQVGVLNTGTVGSIDAAVGALQRDGAADVATAIRSLTEAIAAASELPDDAKNRALEGLSLVATEAAAPPENRRKAAMRPVLQDVGSALSASASLVKIWEFVRPLLAGLF